MFAMFAAHGAAPHGMSAVEYLMAHQQISDYIVVTTRHNDILDKDAHYSTMTEDCEVHMPLAQGKVLTRDAFMEAINKGIRGGMKMAHHTLSNKLINFENATYANSVCYFQAHHFKVNETTGEPYDSVVYGRYMQKWRKCDDGMFRIYSHRVHFDYSDGQWAKVAAEAGKWSDGVLKHDPDAIKVIRDKSDLSYSYLGDAAYGHTNAVGYYPREASPYPMHLHITSAVCFTLLGVFLGAAFFRKN